MKRILTVCLALALTVFSALSAYAAGPAAFSDMAGHWASAEVRSGAGFGLFAGYPDGSFGPERAVTRAEFAKMLVAGLDLPAGGQAGFADVAGHWSEPYVARAVQAGVIANADFGPQFEPDRPITRMEIARMAVRGVEGEAVAAGEPVAFSDRPPDGLGKFVDQAVAYGIIAGYPDGTFGPGRTATRAEAAAILMRTVKARPENAAHLDPGMEPAMAVRQLAYAVVLGKDLDKPNRDRAMLQWATPEVVRELKEQVDAFTAGAGVLVNPAVSSGARWIARGKAEFGLRIGFWANKGGDAFVSAVNYDVQVAETPDGWQVTGFQVTAAEEEWTPSRLPARDTLHRLYRVDDPRIGVFYHRSDGGSPVYIADNAENNKKALAPFANVIPLTLGDFPWNEHPRFAQAANAGWNRTVSSPAIKGQEQIRYSVGMDQVYVLDAAPGVEAGEIRLALKAPMPGMPLVIDGIKWTKLWRDPLFRELARISNAEYEADRVQWEQKYRRVLQGAR